MFCNGGFVNWGNWRNGAAAAVAGSYDLVGE